MSGYASLYPACSPSCAKHFDHSGLFEADHLPFREISMVETLVYIGFYVILIALILVKEIYDVKIIKMPKKRSDIIKLFFFAGLFFISATLVFIQEFYDVIHFTSWRARSALWLIAAIAFVYLIKSLVGRVAFFNPTK